MTTRNLATLALGLGLAIIPDGVRAQQGAAPASSSTRVVVRTYEGDTGVPSRRVETRSTSGDRELRTEVVESPNMDNRMRSSAETVTATIATPRRGSHTSHDVFAYLASGQRTLLQSTESDEQMGADGTGTVVENVSSPDVNGRLVLFARQVRETRSITRDVKQTDIAVFRPSTDSNLVESERIQQTERQLGPAFLRIETTRSVRDPNGRFAPIEERSREVRTTGPSQAHEDETIRRFDVDGKLSLNERHLIQRSVTNGQEQTVDETYSRMISPTIARTDSRIELSQRVRTISTMAADGSGQTVEEVEARNPASPSDPMRLVQRTVETIRKLSADRWQTDREVFVLDVNRRMVLASSEQGEQTNR